MNSSILCIIPHGGLLVPEELQDYVLVDKFELFLNSDSCANDIFNFKKAATVTSAVSKLFIDMNRHYTQLPPKTDDGAVKKHTAHGKAIYAEDFFPSTVALTNIIRRYYTPFQESVKKTLAENNIRLIVECHVSPGIGLKNTPLEDRPLPLVTVYNRLMRGSEEVQTCHNTAAVMLCELLQKNLGEKEENQFIISSQEYRGHLMNSYAKYIPYLRLDISRAFFFDDRFFNLEYIKVDELRIRELRTKIWRAIEKTVEKCI